ncbi:MAG: ribonuclease J [Candidatus Vogelbacteria bacterium]|nr:ribonuclease J [Candidatus Vogelbacteria bacterium]
MKPRPPHRPSAPVSKAPPPLKEDDLRIIPLGGVEEIGKNMTVIEIGPDIIIVDIGLAFPTDDAPGVDYIIPDVTYLEQNKSRVRGVIITHGHLDHTGGIPYIMNRIGNPPLYTRNLTSLFVKKRMDEFPHLPPLNIIVVENDTRVKMGQIPVRFFGVTHTIPDSMGVIVETSYGLIVTPGDFKLDLTAVDGDPTPEEEVTYKIFDKEKTLLLLSDSTNIENPGFSVPERETNKNLEEIIKNIKGRLFIGTFASQLERMIKIIGVAEKYGRKLIVEGRSMKTNIEVATQAGMLKVKKDTFIPATEIDNYPDDKVVILATGAQGEEFAALMRMANKTHKNLKFKKGDTVLLSSSIIPGNEITVQKLKDNIARQGAKIISYRTSEVYIHSSGHGNRGEIEWLHRKIKPKFFIPIHGSHHKLRLHEDLALELGMPEKNIVVPDNGMIIEIQDKGKKIVALKETASSKVIMVDGIGSDNVQEVVIRDRQMLATDGMFVIVILIDTKTGKVRKSPDILSRGFVYLKESQELLRNVRILTKKKIEEATTRMHPINFDYVKNIVREEIGRYLFQKTHKRPIILPVLIEV